VLNSQNPAPPKLCTREMAAAAPESAVTEVLDADDDIRPPCR
jgi:hypothetical protein